MGSRKSKHELRMERLKEKNLRKEKEAAIKDKANKVDNFRNISMIALSVLIIGMFIISNSGAVLPTVGDDAVIGSLDAPITIIAYGDFQCPYTRSFVRDTLADLMVKYEGEVSFVYKDYPKTAEKNHVYAQKAAEAAECADDQGKYWEYFDIMFETNYLDVTSLKNHAESLGLDRDAFDSCLDSGKYRKEVFEDYKEGKKAGVTVTPTFFINGYKLEGLHKLSSFDTVISELQ